MRKSFTPLAFRSIYDKGAIPESWIKSIVARHLHVFEVPTEMVLCPADRNTGMNLGRVWYADEAFGRDKGDDGTWESCRFVIEVMEDVGDDGHVEFSCMGWALVTSVMLNEYLQAARACEDRREFPEWDYVVCEV